MLLKEETSYFYYEILKITFSARSCLRILAAILTWKLSWTPFTNGLHYFNEREQD